MTNDLLIVGAGPTGLTAAVELARRGTIPRVIDKKPKASTLSRAVGINARTLSLLKQSGVSKKLVENGIKVRDARFFIGDKPAFKIDLGLGPKPYDFLLAMPQDRTEELLSRKFRSLGGTIEYGLALEALEPEDSSVCVALAGVDRGVKEDAEYKYILGADGIRSVVRSSAGIEYSGIEVPQEWSIVDFDSASWPHKDKLCLFVYDHGRVCLVVPIGENRYRGVSDRPNAAESMPTSLVIDNIRREGSFVIWVKQAETYQKGNVFIAGDAAHCHSPVGGRGMNLGIADAAWFSRLFINGKLDDYTKIRHEEGRQVIKTTELARKFMTTDWPGKSLILRYIFPALLRFTPLHRSVVKTAIDFPDSG